MTGRVVPGWYPDYEAPPGHQRYWDGQAWTERRSDPAGTSSTAASNTPAGAPARRPRRRPVPGWLWAGGVALAVTVAAAVVVGDDETASPGPGTAPPPPSTPGPPTPGSTPGARAGTDTAGTQGPTRRTWEVAAVLDGAGFELTNGARVRLIGIEDDCGATELSAIVLGRRITLTRKGPDKDVTGALLRYAEVEGVDLATVLLERGLVTAAAATHPRRARYQRLDEASPSACG